MREMVKGYQMNVNATNELKLLFNLVVSFPRPIVQRPSHKLCAHLALICSCHFERNTTMTAASYVHDLRQISHEQPG